MDYEKLQTRVRSEAIELVKEWDRRYCSCHAQASEACAVHRLDAVEPPPGESPWWSRFYVAADIATPATPFDRDGYDRHCFLEEVADDIFESWFPRPHIYESDLVLEIETKAHAIIDSLHLFFEWDFYSWPFYNRAFEVAAMGYLRTVYYKNSASVDTLHVDETWIAGWAQEFADEHDPEHSSFAVTEPLDDDLAKLALPSPLGV